MKISLNWISDYVDINDIDIDWLVKKFTITTAEVEEVHHLENDVVIEIDNKSLTNRPDLWCHYGIAREISAITRRELKKIDYLKEEDLRNISEKRLNIDVEDKEKCLRYSAMKIGNVKIDASPDAIAERLSNCGIRPINIIVDLANYVMLDVGQPLHTFDDNGIDCIRVASLEEQIEFVCLDNIKRTLPKGTLMICGKDKPLAIAGIIGGEESAVSEKTEGIILESATFEGSALRKIASAMGIRTDASARYEKFLDTETTVVAVGRFIKLLQQYQPEIKLDTQLYDKAISPVVASNISINHKYIETYLGTRIDKEVIVDILKRLQFKVEEKNEIYNITAPTYRSTKDITCKADIVEEILRSYGYENIKGIPNKVDVVCPEKNTMKEMEYAIKDIMVMKFNFNEVHSYSWYDSTWLKKLGYAYDDTLSIVNSSVKQFEKLRSDILPNLLKIIYDNRKNFDEISIFELGRVFSMKEGELSQPRHMMAAVYSKRDEGELYKYIKGICSCLLKNVKNIEAEYIQIKDASRENCLGVEYNGIQLGYIYSIPSSILKIFGSRHFIDILNIDLELLDGIVRKNIRYEPVSKYPETYLDFSIMTPLNEPYCKIENYVKEYKHRLIIQTNYISTYIGENVPRNMKSTTFRIIIGNRKGTLQDEEISEVKELFINHLDNYGLKLR